MKQLLQDWWWAVLLVIFCLVVFGPLMTLEGAAAGAIVSWAIIKLRGY